MADRLLRAMRADGVEVGFLPINPFPPRGLRWTERVKVLRTLVCSTFYVWSLLRRVPRYDLLHIFSASYLSFVISQLPAILVGRLYGKPIVLNYHSGQAEDHLRRWGWIVSGILALVDTIVVQSDFLVEVFGRFGFSAVAIPNDVDTRAFAFRKRAHFRPCILVPRTLEPLYNVGCVLRAFREVQAEYPEAELTIMGTGPQRAELEALVGQLNLSLVRFTGRVERDSVPDVFRRHDIFVNASSIDNMPVSILEAFASGLAIVTTAAGGIPWMVSDRVTGHVVPIDDHKAIAQRIIEVIESPEATCHMVDRAFNQLNQYAWPVISQQWYSLYCQLVRGTLSKTHK